MLGVGVNFLHEINFFILSSWKRRNGNIFWENLKCLEYWMMIDVRQNMRAAAEPPSNLRVEKYYGFYSLCLFIEYYTEMAKFFLINRSAGNNFY